MFVKWPNFGLNMDTIRQAVHTIWQNLYEFIRFVTSGFIDVTEEGLMGVFAVIGVWTCTKFLLTCVLTLIWPLLFILACLMLVPSIRSTIIDGVMEPDTIVDSLRRLLNITSDTTSNHRCHILGH